MPEQVPRTELQNLRSKAVQAHQAGNLSEALQLYVKYLNSAPGDGAIWSNLGALFRASGAREQAIRAHGRAYRLTPDNPGTRNNFANALADIGRYDRSIALRREILRDSPEDAQQKALIGRALRSSGDYGGAIQFLEQSLEDHPDDPEIELQLAFAQLGIGNYDKGFEHYRARWRTSEISPIDLPYPRWAGEDLTGKTVLVMPEQGFGDAVLTMRFLPWLKERCDKVICLAEKPMARLFSRVDGADLVSVQVKQSSDIDVFLSLMDLPRLGLIDRENIPEPTGLHVPEDSAERAADIVRPYKSLFRVGVVWSGSTTYKGNAARSFSHREFLPLTENSDVQFFSLYKGPQIEAFHADGSGAFMVDAGSSDRDFADCAAMMQAMDLIITSDTATAHIAGSLGVPTWVVLHWDPFWVYTHTGDTTPWYPSMRLFRQTEPFVWDDVFREINAALEHRVAGVK